MTAMHPSSSTTLPPALVAADGDVAAARRFLRYVDASPTPFHCVATSAAMLDAAGFTRLKESQLWDGVIKRGGKYYYTRNQSALIAFAVGNDFEPGNGVNIVAGHSDSPRFLLKPVSKRTKEGYLQCSVAVYGGPILATWFDRDLSIAGRVIVADKKNGGFTTRLVHVKRPILRIPTLAIHLNRTVNEAFKFDNEDNTAPILGLASAELNKKAPASAQDADASSQPAGGLAALDDKHHSVLLQLLASELEIDADQIQDFELSLYDTQPASIGGIQNEFIHSPRLDNQMSCFCATEGLINSLKSSDALKGSAAIRAIALFDHEEVGSVSTHGAASNMLPALIHRLASITLEGVTAAPHPTSTDRSIARSFLVSSDMAHAVHPNYPSYHEDNHRPKLNAGPVVKVNAQERYATTGLTSFLLDRTAKLAGVPLQSFVVKNNMGCGSTIGPMLSKLGLRTVDIGNPQLSMHSIRETCGTKDVEYKIRLFETFFERFEEVDREVTTD